MSAPQTLHTPQEAARWLRTRVTGGLTTDSRKVRAGDGFIAWPGAATDGRLHVNAAFSQGASACLVAAEGVEAFAFRNEAVATYAKLKSATGPIAAAYFDEPSKLLNVIAITGTNGKTSTAWWLAHALSNLSRPNEFLCGLVGTLGIAVPEKGQAGAQRADEYSFEVQTNSLTTPDPVLLQQNLRRFVARGLMACALEASSIGIVENRLDATQIRVAVFTNFSQDHLDYHGTMSAYWQAKASLFDWPGLQAAVVNIDDEKGAELVASLTSGGRSAALDLWTTSCKLPARLRATDIFHSANGMRFTVIEAGASHDLATHLIGHYNVHNLLGVIGAMRTLGVPLRACVEACTSLQPVPGRLQCFGEPGEPLVAVDYAHTPDALAKTLEVLRPLAQARGGKLWCVFGCGGRRDASKRPLMGAIAVRHADYIVITSDNPRDESQHSIISQIMLGTTGHNGIEVQTDRALAISDAVLRADSVDVILVAGKGHEDYQEINGRKMPFADQRHVSLALQRRKDGAANGKGAAS